MQLRNSQRWCANIGCAALICLLSSSPAAGQQMDLSFLVTRAEASGYEETTGYDEAVGFLEVAAAQSTRLHLTHFGYSVEGRRLPLVVWGTDDANAATVKDDTRLRVFVQANIHAGEVCGKDAMLAMIRDLAAGRYDDWSDDVILIIAPIYNVDGNERVNLYNRPRQNGPVGGMGQRPNARELDLNRDHMKLASPEARALVGVMNDYDPHVLVDLHTTNGSQHGYHLTYSPPLNPNTGEAIDNLLREEFLPAVTRTIKATHDWDFYYYGNLPFRGGEPGWYTFDHRPRFNNNYVGLRNRVAILSEAYAYATYRERVLASRAFVEEIVSYAAANSEAIRAAIAEAEGQVLAGSDFAVRSGFERSATQVDIIMGGTESIRNPYSGAMMRSMTDERRVESMYEYGSFAATETTRLPSAYVVPGNLRVVTEMLDDHGISYRVATQESTVIGEEFIVDSLQVAGRPFQGVEEQTLFGHYVEADVTLNEGDLWVETAQPLGRLLAYLLEPRSDDGMVNWGKFSGLDEASVYPIRRVPANDAGDS